MILLGQRLYRSVVGLVFIQLRTGTLDRYSMCFKGRNEGEMSYCHLFLYWGVGGTYLEFVRCVVGACYV